MHAASTESFYPYYGVNDDGNIFDPSNLESLKKFVLQHSENKGVHFLMADGVKFVFNFDISHQCKNY